METIELGKLANTIQAYKSCIESNNIEWKDKHKDYIDLECKKLPHGSGLDAGVTLDLENSTPSKLIFDLSFHHMDDNGYYDGWTDHKLIVTPEFGHYHIKITGQNKREIKDYLSQLFYEVFTVKSI
jgi:hypothetical protein